MLSPLGQFALGYMDLDVSSCIQACIQGTHPKYIAIQARYICIAPTTTPIQPPIHRDTSIVDTSRSHGIHGYIHTPVPTQEWYVSIHGVLEIGIFCQRTCRFLKHLHVVQFRNWGSKVPLDFYKPISTRPHDDYGFTDPPLSVHKLHEAVLNLDIVKG